MSERYDILIKDSRIIDGTGRPAFKGSIGIEDEKITIVGSIQGDATREIDGSGLVVCPGFIDMHNHGDLTVLQYPLAENYLMQGITSFVGGNCGASMAPIKEFMPWGIFTPGFVESWWHEVEPHTYGPPQLLQLDKYGELLEEKLGFAIDWRTFGEYLSKVEKLGTSVNYVPLVGHNSVRLVVMGADFKRRANPHEIKEMKVHVEEAMKNGAFGLATGLDGNPGDFASTEEIIELAKITRKYGGLYFSHTRNYDNNYPTDNPKEWGYGICHNITLEEMPVAKYFGFLEAIEVGRKAKIPVHIAHLCPAYTIYQYYPKYLKEAAAKATLDIINKARVEGLDITFDLIPDHDVHGVLLSQPSLINLFSKWVKLFGSKKRLIENLKVKEFRDELKSEIMGGKFKFIMIHPKTDQFWMNRVVIIVCRNKGYEGKTIGEIAQAREVDPFNTLFDIIIEDPETKFNIVDPRWSEATLRVFLKHPTAMIGSDLNMVPFVDAKFKGGGGLSAGEPGLAHYAFFPRYIRRYVREQGVLGLEEAVKKATYLPAQTLGLKDRGAIRPGAYADIVIFDFEKIGDKGTWLKPRQRPEGISHVLVNGKVAYENMAHTGAKSGKILKRG